MAYFHSPRIATNELYLLVDALNTKSYSGSGTSFKNIIRPQNATVVNAVYNSAGYFSLDGTGDYIQFPTLSGFNPDNNRTSISVWVRATNTQTTNATIFGDNFNPEYSITWNTNNTIQFTSDTSYTYSTASLNKWYFLTLNSDNSSGTTTSIQAFVDGVQVGSSTGNHGNGLNDQPFVLGADYNGGTPNKFFIGDIAICMMYTKLLNSAEVLQNYNATKSRFGL